MARHVVDASVVLHLLAEGIGASTEHELLAPTLLRSQVLEALFRAVESGEVAEAVGLDRLGRFARMRVRFLGDKVLRRRAWSVAKQLRWPSTHDAEYVALTALQADAFVTLDTSLASAVRRLVPVAPLSEVL